MICYLCFPFHARRSSKPHGGGVVHTAFWLPWPASRIHLGTGEDKIQPELLVPLPVSLPAPLWKQLLLPWGSEVQRTQGQMQQRREGQRAPAELHAADVGPWEGAALRCLWLPTSKRAFSAHSDCERAFARLLQFGSRRKNSPALRGFAVRPVWLGQSWNPARRSASPLLASVPHASAACCARLFLGSSDPLSASHSPNCAPQLSLSDTDPERSTCCLSLRPRLWRRHHKVGDGKGRWSRRACPGLSWTWWG